MIDKLYTIRDLHYDYLISHPNSKQEFKQFEKIISTVNKKIVHKVLENGLQVRLPFLGVFKMLVKHAIYFTDKDTGLYTRFTNKYKTEDKKKEILARGETLKNKENPEGKDYKVYLNNPFFFTYHLTRNKKALVLGLKYFKVEFSKYALITRTAHFKDNEENYNKGVGIYEHKKIFNKRDTSQNL